jgi:hypothetical protein
VLASLVISAPSKETQLGQVSGVRGKRLETAVVVSKTTTADRTPSTCNEVAAQIGLITCAVTL